ncbi:hypothetical protein F5Y03DRAFT_370764 [Xylaria venustula]|nr:hypothetical protein F5Y03DRAFT_370764 [Xylaria venustula]
MNFFFWRADGVQQSTSKVFLHNYLVLSLLLHSLFGTDQSVFTANNCTKNAPTRTHTHPYPQVNEPRTHTLTYIQ